MGYQRDTVRVPVRRGGLRPPVVLWEGGNRVEANAQHCRGRVWFPWQLQFFLDAFPGEEISRELRRDGDEEVVPGPDHGSAPGHQRLLHRSVGCSRRQLEAS